jgi:hypothetical protein
VFGGCVLKSEVFFLFLREKADNSLARDFTLPRV